MSYKKLVNDLLSECPKNCADCEYSEGVEFNCTMSRMTADAILELFIENKILNKKNFQIYRCAQNLRKLVAICLRRWLKNIRTRLFLDILCGQKGRAGPFTNEGGMSCEQERNPF